MPIFDIEEDCNHGDDEDRKCQILIDGYCKNETSQMHFDCSETNKYIS